MGQTGRIARCHEHQFVGGRRLFAIIAPASWTRWRAQTTAARPVRPAQAQAADGAHNRNQTSRAGSIHPQPYASALDHLLIENRRVVLTLSSRNEISYPLRGIVGLATCNDANFGGFVVPFRLLTPLVRSGEGDGCRDLSGVPIWAHGVLIGFIGVKGG